MKATGAAAALLVAPCARHPGRGSDRGARRQHRARAGADRGGRPRAAHGPRGARGRGLGGLARARQPRAVRGARPADPRPDHRGRPRGVERRARPHGVRAWRDRATRHRARGRRRGWERGDARDRAVAGHRGERRTRRGRRYPDHQGTARHPARSAGAPAVAGRDPPGGGDRVLAVAALSRARAGRSRRAGRPRRARRTRSPTRRFAGSRPSGCRTTGRSRRSTSGRRTSSARTSRGVSACRRWR